MAPEHLLTGLFLVPLLGTIAIALSPEKSARSIAIVLGLLMVVLSAILGANFKPDVVGLQFIERVSWIQQPFPIEYHVGVDGMSMCLVVMTTVVTLLAIIASDTIGNNRPRLYYSMIMLLTTSIMGVFISLDLLQFFVLWELELVPMYFLIAIWGGPRRDYAAMKFLIYTFFGGILMLAGLLYLYLQLGQMGLPYQTFDMEKLVTYCPQLTGAVQSLACLGFLAAFLIKLPSFPVHTWLPDAHVEAPTPISMILAGLLLKMGSYGLVRVCLGFFPDAMVAFSIPLVVLGCFNIVWAAIACLAQEDMKRVIAYSSVSHMGFVTLGIGSLSAAAISGAIFQMISHGFVSAMLFFLVGTVYERCHTRQISEIGGGLAKQMPYIFYFWMFATMANLGLPGLSGFVGEVAVFYGSFTSQAQSILAEHKLVHASIMVACFGVVLTAGYMLWLLKRLFYGPELPKWAGHLSDARASEKLVGYALALCVLALGIYPMLVTNQYRGYTDRLADSLNKRPQISAQPVPDTVVY